jgi:hypothetical protein
MIWMMRGGLVVTEQDRSVLSPDPTVPIPSAPPLPIIKSALGGRNAPSCSGGGISPDTYDANLVPVGHDSDEQVCKDL